jgi:hypothetical protein
LARLFRIRKTTGSNLDPQNGYTGGDFPQFLQTTAGMEPEIMLERFLPYPFQFIIHSSSGHPTLLSELPTASSYFKTNE